MHHTSQLFATNPYSVTMLPVYKQSRLVAGRNRGEKWRVCLCDNRSVTVPMSLQTMNPLHRTFKYLYTSRALCASA